MSCSSQVSDKANVGSTDSATGDLMGGLVGSVAGAGGVGKQGFCVFPTSKLRVLEAIIFYIEQ